MSGEVAGSIRISTELDTKELESSLASLKKTAATGLKTALAVATAALVKFGVDAINVASDLSEVQNVVDTTFGDGAGKIEEFARNAKTAFGLSELSAKKYTGTMGAMLKSMGLSSDAVLQMSTDMTGLAGDFASFYNLDHEDAFNKIRAGISGETEPLKELGINMSVANLEAYALSQGIEKSYNTMTQAEQATLRYNYLMSVTADAQGDFAKTAETSLANSLRILSLEVETLSASIGKDLLPAALIGTQKLREMVQNLGNAYSEGGFEGLARSIGSTLANIAQIVAEYYPQLSEVGWQVVQALIIGIMESTPDIITNIVDLLTTLGDVIIENSLNMLMSIVDTVPVVTTALAEALPQIVSTIVTFLISSIPKILEGAIKLLNALIDAIPTIIQALNDNLPLVIEAILAGIIDGLPQILEGAITLLHALIDAIPVIIEELVIDLPTIITTIVDALIEAIPDIYDAATELFWGIITAIPGFVVDLAGKIPSIITAIVAGLAVGVGQMVESGFNLVKGIWQGMSNSVSWIKQKIRGWVGNVTQFVKDLFGIASPSKVMRDLIGVNLVKGIGVGFDKEMPALKKDVTAQLGWLTDYAANVDVGLSARGVSLKEKLNLSLSAVNTQNTNRIVLEVDGMTLAEVVNTYNNKMELAYGG